MSKRMILSVLVMGALTLALLQATGAYFLSRKSTGGSSFSVGTLDLEVGGVNGTKPETFVIDNLGDGTVTNGGKTWVITNKGSLKGRLFMRLDNLNNKENGCNAPEAEVDFSCGDPGENEGELGEMITVSLYLDDQKIIDADLSSANVNSLTDAWSNLNPIILNGGESATVRLEWQLNSSDYGNEIQSDSLNFDVNFDLTQAI